MKLPHPDSSTCRSMMEQACCSRVTSSVFQTLREQLKEAKAEAGNMESNHKRVIQLLQTELLDAQVLVKEKENTVQTLKVQQEESEVCLKISLERLHQLLASVC